MIFVIIITLFRCQNQFSECLTALLRLPDPLLTNKCRPTGRGGRETSDNAALTVGAMDAACHANTLGRAVANENTTNGPATLKKATRTI